MADARSRLDESFDLVLLDRNLPDGDGLDLARELNALEGGPAVIVITGHVGPEHRLAAEDAGARYLAKPVRRPALLDAVRDSLARHQAEPDDGSRTETDGSDSAAVLVEADIADLVEEFLADWRSHVLDMEALLGADDFTELYRLGHNLKGSGAGYGFPKLSRMGEVIERAAAQKLPGELQASIDELGTYLSRVTWRAK